MPQQDGDASEANEAKEVFGMPFPSCGESPEVLEPGEESFDFPSPPVSTQRPAILGGNFPVPPVRRDHRDASGREQMTIERIRVVRLVADQKLGLHVEKSVVERVVDEGDFSW